MLDVVFPLWISKHSDKMLAIVGDDFDECAPLAEDILEDPFSECLRVFFLEHAELRVVREGAAALYNIIESV